MRVALVVLALAVAGSVVCGQEDPPRPPQFDVWADRGPEFPPAPAGWIEAPSRDRPEVHPTDAEAAVGLALFRHEPFGRASVERATRLSAFCTPGEYEPLGVSVCAVGATRDITIDVTELVGLGDSTIPKDQIDVRVARAIRVPSGAQSFSMEPSLLEKRPRLTLAEGDRVQAWITVRAPDATPPGIYSGTLSARASGLEAAHLPLQFEVLPFALPRTPIEMGAFMARPPEDEKELRRQLIDVREHGMTAVQPMPDAEVVTRDRVLGDDDIHAMRERSRKRMRIYRDVFGEWRFPVTMEIGHQIAYYWDQQRSWFAFWPHSQTIDDDLLRALDAILEVADEESWPRVRAYALDEAGAHNLLDEAIYYYGLLAGERPAVETWTTIGGGIALGHDEIGRLSGIVDKLSTNRFSPAIARALVDRDTPYGVYNGAGPTPPGARFSFGFYGFKTGADEIMQWCYSFGDNVFSGRGVRMDDEGYVYSPDGAPLPSLMWEAAREGVDDYRYAYALWQVLQTDGIPAEMVEGARRTLREVMAQIPWTFQAVQAANRTPPPTSLTLTSWRRQIADELVRLHERGVRPPADGSAPLPSPFAWEWAEPPQERVTYGPELLASSDFEHGPGPWRIEPWEGEGGGAIETGRAHTGAQSMRVDVPVGESTTAVTVLVCPSWGEGDLDLALEARRTYELSAWIKVEGRNIPPEIRLAVPAGAEGRSVSGQDEADADGWSRVWRRVTMEADADARYLAVWVQGPGTVWVDDLSLREATVTGQ